ncbi:hypothetical protein BC835DRAFT_952268 [Cytidiella melzeri]|nr:hypothetical protein BC835DRAFT_952268 [Cytidiella melzeri]
MTDQSSGSFCNLDIPLPFELFASLLTLGHKYMIDDLIASGIARLRVLFPSNFDDWTDWIVDGKVSTPIEMSVFDVIPVIKLARLLGCPDILPVAFYACCSLRPAALLEGTFSCGRQVKLSHADIATCLNMRDKLLVKSSRIRRVFLEIPFAHIDGSRQHDSRSTQCTATARKLAMRVLDHGLLSDSYCFTRMDPWISGVQKELGEQLCPSCMALLRTDMNERMRQEWLDLGSMVGKS